MTVYYVATLAVIAASLEKFGHRFGERILSRDETESLIVFDDVFVELELVDADGAEVAAT